MHEARVMKKKSLADYASTLRIPERYLRALEEEDLSGFPGIVYEKNFIHRYALALGLSPTPLITGWSALRHNSIAPATQFVARVRWRDLWVSPFFWRKFFAGLIVILVGVYLGGRLLVMVRPPELTITSPRDELATAERTIVVSGATEQEVAVTINGEIVPIKRDGSFAVPLTLQPGANTVRIAATKRYSRTAIVERQVFVTTTPAVSQTNKESGARLGSYQ